MPVESAWVIRRARLEIERLPTYGEILELETWCTGAAASIAGRATRITGTGGSSLRADAVWVHVDPELRRPARLPDEFHRIFDTATGKRPRTSLRHPAEPPAGAEAHRWEFARADIDLADHVNNAVYLRLLEQFLDISPLHPEPGEETAGALIEAEYRSGIGPGPAEVLTSGTMAWVRSPGAATAATLSISPL
jgi:acyl-ACP thioesterase